MNDQELLVFAARAAGIDWYDDHAAKLGLGLRNKQTCCLWNPLTSGSDALYLAVVLGIDISVHKNKSVYSDSELYYSTLRSVTTKAAEIGRTTL